ncbi:undecaprenyl/decaprenyl-phosphate alpha-N-acetylglucosaminyl 1-phosphate transferase [Streptomyces pratensis]|uniref:MraY family glycosyltransferase n=1 Tax=Streptomyces pratensis TaxID=1169025 RepID=UPI003017CB69
MNVLGIIATGMAALVITVVLAKAARRAAYRPQEPHGPEGRAPRGRVLRHAGGAAVALGVGAATGAAVWLGAADDSAGSVLGVLAGAALVALLGLVHDLKPLWTALRLAVQTAAAVLVVCFAGLSPAAAALAVVWIVLVTNAFALLDHSGGVLAAVGVVTAAGLFVCATLYGGRPPALLPAALEASLVGLLLHCRRPARLCLGSCGAQFTGFVLASSGALIQAAAPPGRAAWAALPVLATVALADAALVVVSRRRAARPLLRGADDHIAHRLRRLRVTAPGTAILLALWAGVPVLAGTLVYAQLLHPALLLVPLAGTAAAVFGLLRVPVYAAPSRPSARRAPTGRRTGPPDRAAMSRPVVERPAWSRPFAPRAVAPAAAGPAKAALRRTGAGGGRTAPGVPVERSPGAVGPSGPVPARTAAGRPTVPPPPTGRTTAPVAAERS